MPLSEDVFAAITEIPEILAQKGVAEIRKSQRIKLESVDGKPARHSGLPLSEF